MAQVRKNNLPLLYVAAFLMAFVLGGIWWVALPFIVKRLGGSDANVGQCFALHMGLYMGGCLLVLWFLHRLERKRTVQIGVTMMILSTMVACAIIASGNEQNPSGKLVGMLIIACGFMGLSMTFFWPFLPGWISEAYEGRELNRRLGLFNTSWSSGAMVGPLIGGLLVQKSSLLAMVAVVIGLALCLTMITLAPKSRDGDPTPQKPNTPPSPEKPDRATLLVFRWTSRIALLACTCILMGLFRSQLGLLFKFELGFSEFDFGVVTMFMAGANFLVLVAAGKWHFWHYRVGFFAAAQLAVLSCLVIILFGSKQWHFMVAATALGAGTAFVYASHLYYSVSGSTRRSASMAIHETTLSLGTVFGALVGGYLSDLLGRRWPYWFGIAVILTGALIQIVVCLAIRRRHQNQATQCQVR